jgi:hypothetical protein
MFVVARRPRPRPRPRRGGLHQSCHVGHGAAIDVTGAVSDAGRARAPSRRRLPSSSSERPCCATAALALDELQKRWPIAGAKRTAYAPPRQRARCRHDGARDASLAHSRGRSSYGEPTEALGPSPGCTNLLRGYNQAAGSVRSGPASVSISGPCGRVPSTVSSFDVGDVVVAAADDAVADRDGDRSVVDVVAELPLRPELLARRGVERLACVVLARSPPRSRCRARRRRASSPPMPRRSRRRPCVRQHACSSRPNGGSCRAGRRAGARVRAAHRRPAVGCSRPESGHA